VRAQRRDEDELWQHFEQARPRILGALLSAVSAALRNRPGVRLPSKTRMADFACWVVAAEPALAWSAGAFLGAYTVNRGAADALAVEASIVAPLILVLIAQVQLWQGTARELLDELEGHYADEKTRKRKDWPTSPRKLSGELRRLAPNLRRFGVVVSFGAHTKRGTPIRIEQCGKTSSPPSPQLPGHADKPLQGDGLDDEADGQAGLPSPSNPMPNKGGDDGDEVDDAPPAQSDSEEIVEWTA
jgi:hypothetical protein